MKTNYRFILAGVILACIAALGFSHSAWAGPLEQGTVPSCPTTGTISRRGKITTCHAVVEVLSLPVGSSVTSTEIDVSSLNQPRRGKATFGVQVSFADSKHKFFPILLVSVCFPDPSGRGVVYRYFPNADWRTFYNSNEPGRWVVIPTFHRSNNPAGYTCAQTWLGGIYTIIY